MIVKVKKYLDPIYIIFTKHILGFPGIIARFYKAKIFLNKDIDKIYHLQGSIDAKGKVDLDLVTVAFNNWKVITLQHKNIKKYLRGSYRYIVVDNSSNENSSLKIRKYCTKNKITYFRLTDNPYSGVIDSMSHGIAINWIYKHYVKYSKSKYLGIIDHDIFPIRETDIVSKLESQNIYGHYQSRNKRWYLWSGFCFYNLSFLKNYTPNFKPVRGLDSGGGNWRVLYRHLDFDDLKWPQHKYIKYQSGCSIQSSSVELIGDWLHLMSVSGWMTRGKVKDVGIIMDKIKGKLK